MRAKDYYEVLGVRRGASDDEIRQAYRDLARKLHPDVSKEPDAAKRFNEVAEAYEVLSNSEKRQAYDRFGHAGVSAGAAGGPRGGGWGGAGEGGPNVWSTSEGFGGSVPSDFSDLFEQMFSGGGGNWTGAGPQRGAGRGAAGGADIEQRVTVSFLTAALGGAEEVTIKSGSGSQRIDVKIPPGIEDGAKLRIKGKGGPGPHGAAPGDLIVTVVAGEHPWFTRDGVDILIQVPISLAEAALGTTVDVPMLKGTVQLKVPAGASSGQKLRVKGKGITGAKGGPGDFYAVIQIVAPPTLSDRGRTLVEELAGELQNPRKGGPWSTAEGG